MDWPRCRGHKLSFLAQLRLSDVAAAAPGTIASTGTLAVFAELNENEEGYSPIEEAYGPVGRRRASSSASCAARSPAAPCPRASCG